MTKLTSNQTLIPVLPLRDVVVYPNMVIPLFVGRDKSIDALNNAIKENGQVLLVAQKEADIDSPEIADLYEMGTLANVLQMLKLPDGTVKVLMEGEERSRVVEFQKNDGFLCAQVDEVEETYNLDEHEKDVLERTALSSFENYVKLNNKIPAEVLSALSEIDDPSRLADTMAAHMTLKQRSAFVCALSSRWIKINANIISMNKLKPFIKNWVKWMRLQQKLMI